MFRRRCVWLFGLGWGRAVTRNAWRRALRDHRIHRSCQECAIFDGPLHPDCVAYLNVRQRDGVAALAEGSVFVGYNHVGCVIESPISVILTPSMAVTFPISQVFP